MAIATTEELRPGEEFAGYRVEGLVGSGGMGVVYHAFDLRLKRPVALKLLAPELSNDAGFRQRFLRESELAASLDHSHVTPVYEAGEVDGRLYLAMRFVDGTDLRSLLEREGPLAPERALELVSQVAAALDAAHAKGLVHRDVKPANILIAEEQGGEHCYLTDFGLSRGVDDDVQRPSTHLSGTVAYTAPEQILNERLTGQADLYSLACVLYESLAGQPPFHGSRPSAVLFAHVESDVPPLSGYPALDAVLAAALAKDPEARPRTARNFVDAARAALGLTRELPAELDATGPLVGRVRELRQLRELWASARSGHGRVICLVGTRGMGKTRLAAELAREALADGAVVRYAACVGSSEPARGMLAAIERAVAAELLVLDDLDTADAALHAEVTSKLAATADRPCLLIVTSRRAPVGPFEEIRLTPLDAAGVSEITALLGVADAPAERIASETGGVPLRVQEAIGEWLRAEASRRVDEAAARAVASRSELRAAEAELAANVGDLQAMRERLRSRAQVDPDSCPFKGLASFEAEDADLYFGRERLVAELVARLAGATLLGVVGASGSGKSSLIRAGLLPGLAAGVLPGSSDWGQAVLRPGGRPLRELERALSVREVDQGLVLVVDQFEEIFTQCRKESDRRAFVTELVLQAQRGTLVVLVIRADFYGKIADFPELAALLAENHVLVGPMQADELKRAIELPAERGGLQVAPGLSDVLVRDVADEPGGLPLLSTTLVELWQQREGQTLRLEAYRASGGVRGAVARLAERAYAKLDAEEQRVARSLLMRLAAGEGTNVARRRAPLVELDLDDDPRGRRVLDLLAASRLITVSEGAAEVAHEALLREWPRLRDWLVEDAEGRRLHRHLTEAAREWDEQGRDPAELYRGARLAAVLDWAATHGSDLNELERTFVEESRAGANAETRRVQRTNRRLRGLLTASGALLVAAIAAAALAVSSRSDATHAATAATAQRLGAQALLAKNLDLSLLLARQGVALDDSLASEGNLEGALVRSPAAIRQFRPVRGRPLSVDVSPNGRFLSIDNNNFQTAIVDARTDHVVRTVASAFSLFGVDSRLITVQPIGKTERTTELVAVDPSTGAKQVLGAYTPQADGHNSWSRDEHTITLQEANGDVAVRMLKRRRVLHRFGPLPGLKIADLELPGHNLLLAFETPHGDPFAEPATIDVHTLAPWRRRVILHVTGSPTGVTFAVSPDGRELALGHSDGSIDLYDLADGRSRVLQGRHTEGVIGVGFTPDGKTIVSTSDDQQVLVWDVASGALREALEGHAGRVFGPAFSRDGRTVYTASLDGSVIAWDLAGDRRLGRPFSVGTGEQDGDIDFTNFSVSPDGKLLVEATQRGLVRLVNVHSGRTLETIPVPGGHVFDVRWNRDGTMFATGGALGHVDLWRRTGEHVRALHGQTASAYALAFDPDGRLLAAAGKDARIYVWDLHSGTIVRSLRSPSPAFRLAFSPDGRLLAAADGNDPPPSPGGFAHVWRVADGKQLYETNIDDGYGAGSAVAFTPDGKLLATGGGTGVVKFWDAATGKPSGRSLLVNAGWAMSIDFDSTGRLMLTGGTDGSARLFDVRARAPYGTPLPKPAVANGANDPSHAAFIGRGGAALVVFKDGRALLWDLRPLAWERRACSIAGRTLTPDEWAQYLRGRRYHPACG